MEQVKQSIEMSQLIDTVGIRTMCVPATPPPKLAKTQLENIARQILGEADRIRERGGRGMTIMFGCGIPGKGRQRKLPEDQTLTQFFQK